MYRVRADRLRRVSRSGSSTVLAATRFLAVGGVAFFRDAGLYNLLVFVGGRGPLFDLPFLAKIISILTATFFTYIGSKYFTFSDSNSRTTWRQIFVFICVNIVAILLQLSCLGFSRYVLGLSDIVADNVWGTVIGQIVAMSFRFVAYRIWVFPAAGDV